MASYGHLYSRYFRASDFPTDGQEFTIVTARPEKPSRNDDEEKLVVYVKEDPRGIVLNSGRYKSLVELFGSDDVDTWKDGRIRCVQIKQSFQGKTVPGFAIEAAN